MSVQLKALVKMSRFYGSNPDFLLAGGGNTSYKDDKYLYVKASGFKLAEICEDGFVKLERKALNGIWGKEYPLDTDLREQQALQDLLDARAEGETKRPSVESLLHAVLPQKIVVHTHPAIVNGLTCSKNGRATAFDLFHPRSIWVPSVNPGYTLAREIRSRLINHSKEYKTTPDLIFLENHGIFVCAGSVENVKRIHNRVIKVLKRRIAREPDFSAVSDERTEIERIICCIKKHPLFRNSHILFGNNREIMQVVADAAAFQKVHSAFTPDHIVYAGPESLFIESIKNIENIEQLHNDIEAYRKRNGCCPRIIAVRNKGVYASGDSDNAASTAMLLFLDTIKIAVYAENFGGYSFMNKEQIDFIAHWEAEKFRANVSMGKIM